jgi:hypothetical protein
VTAPANQGWFRSLNLASTSALEGRAVMPCKREHFRLLLGTAASVYTTDGIHENEAANLAISASGAIHPAVVSR